MFVAAATIEDDVNAAGMVDRGRMARRKAGLRKRKAIFSVGRAKEPRSSGSGPRKYLEKERKFLLGSQSRLLSLQFGLLRFGNPAPRAPTKL